MPCHNTIVVMYHYVRQPDPKQWAGLHPLAPKDFEKQLDYLSGVGDIISPRRLDDAPRRARDSILLTFDDGTRDHYEVVFPILQRRGLTALFGPISGPALGEATPNVHLIHRLTSASTDEKIWAALRTAFRDLDLGLPERAAAAYPRDLPLRARVKFALNFVLEYEKAQEFLLSALAGRGVHRPGADWYLSEAQIAEMHAAGNEFAVHAHRHAAYADPAEDFCRHELGPCEAWLARLTGDRPRFYIAPFGGASAAGAAPEALTATLRARGYRHGFLTSPGRAAAPPREFWLPRFDAAELPPRGAPLTAPAAEAVAS
jgi:peptidoglycan/xylan/chitin deacetylase (PgdA/CDA1 family)